MLTSNQWKTSEWLCIAV